MNNKITRIGNKIKHLIFQDSRFAFAPHESTVLELKVDALQNEVDNLKAENSQIRADLNELLSKEYDKYAYDVKFLELYDYVFNQTLQEKKSGERPIKGFSNPPKKRKSK